MGITPNCFVYSDASGTGCGAHMTLNQEYRCHTMWSENERMKSSTWRELYARSSILQPVVFLFLLLQVV